MNYWAIGFGVLVLLIVSAGTYYSYNAYEAAMEKDDSDSGSKGSSDSKGEDGG